MTSTSSLRTQVISGSPAGTGSGIRGGLISNPPLTPATLLPQDMPEITELSGSTLRPQLVNYQSITAIHGYENHSFEELRVNDYNNGRKPVQVTSSANCAGRLGDPFTQSPLFGSARTQSISQQATAMPSPASVASTSRGTLTAFDAREMIDQRRQSIQNPTVTPPATMRSPSIARPAGQDTMNRTVTTNDTPAPFPFPTQERAANSSARSAPAPAAFRVVMPTGDPPPPYAATADHNSTIPGNLTTPAPSTTVTPLGNATSAAPSTPQPSIPSMFTSARPNAARGRTNIPVLSTTTASTPTESTTFSPSTNDRFGQNATPSTTTSPMPPPPTSSGSEFDDIFGRLEADRLAFSARFPSAFSFTTNQHASGSTPATACRQVPSTPFTFTAPVTRPSSSASPSQRTNNGTESTAAPTLAVNITSTSLQESATSSIPVPPCDAPSQYAGTSSDNVEPVTPVSGLPVADGHAALNINASASGSGPSTQSSPVDAPTVDPVREHDNASTSTTIDTPAQSSSAAPLPVLNTTSGETSAAEPSRPVKMPVKIFDLSGLSRLRQFHSTDARAENDGIGHGNNTTSTQDSTPAASATLTTEHIPITLLNRIFGQLVDDVRNTVPTEAEHGFRAALSNALSAPNVSMLVDNPASLGIFTRLADEYLGIRFISEVPGEAAMFSRRVLVDNHPYIMIDVGFPSPFTNPFVPNVDAYKRYVDSLSDDTSTLPALPCLHILFHGTSLSIAGSVMASGIHRFEVLTSDIPLSHHDVYDESVRNQAALTFGAMANAAKKLKDLYSGDIMTSSVLREPYPTSYRHLETNLQVTLTLDELVKERELEYYGREDNSTPVVVQFVRSQDLQRVCFLLGHAPLLRGVEKLPGGWAIVITDHGKNREDIRGPPQSTTSIFEAPPLSTECDAKTASDAMKWRRFVSMLDVALSTIRGLCWTQWGVGM